MPNSHTLLVASTCLALGAALLVLASSTPAPLHLRRAPSSAPHAAAPGVTPTRKRALHFLHPALRRPSARRPDVGTLNLLPSQIAGPHPPAVPVFAPLCLATLAGLCGAAVAVAVQLLAPDRNSPLPQVAMAAGSGEYKLPTIRKGKYSGYKEAIKNATAVTYAQFEATLQEGFTMVDVRPRYERERMYPAGSINVELVRENDASPLDLMSLGRKWASTSYAGYTRDLLRNMNFGADVEKAVGGKDAKVLLVCGDGLRSLVGAKTLFDEGFTQVRWLEDGLQMVEGRPALRTEGTAVDMGYANACLDSGMIAVKLLRMVGMQD